MPNGDHLKRVTPGQTFTPSASWHNAVSDLVRRYGGKLTVGGAASAGRPVPVAPRGRTYKIGSNATGAGCYVIRRVSFGFQSGTTEFDSTAATLGLTNYHATESVDMLGVNLEEVGRTSTHDLAVNDFCFGELTGMHDDQGRPVVFIRAIHRGNCAGS